MLLLKSHIHAHDRHMQSGKVVHVREHDDSRQAVIAPSGRDSFGSIQGEIAMAAKIPPGPIKLFKGAQFAEHSGFGKLHIEEQHGDEIRKAGYKGPEDFVADVIRNVSALYQVGDNRFAMVADGRQQRVHIVELRHEAGKQFYSIVTGYIVERTDFDRRGHRLLWKKGMRKGLLEMFLLRKSSDETEIKVRLRDRDASLVKLLKELRARANPGHSFDVHIDPDAGQESGHCGFDGDGGFWIGDIEVDGQLQKSHISAHLRTERSGKVTQVHDYDDSRRKRVAANKEDARRYVVRAWARGDEEEDIHRGLHKLHGVKGAEAKQMVEDHKKNKEPAKPKTLLVDLPAGLRKKCERAEPGKGGEITLTQAEVAIMLKKGVFGLISAGRNPNDAEDKQLSDSDITMRYEKLKQDLVDKGLKFCKVRGKYEGLEEDTLMVMTPDMQPEEALELGERYHQDSVIYVDHCQNTMHYTTGQHKGERNIGEGFDNLPEAQEDYYTEIKTTEGKKLKFILHFDFGNYLKALKDFALRLLEKAHIHTFSRKTASGKVSIVREHEDSRKPSEEARHFHEETHPQKGGGMRLAKMTIDDIVKVTRQGLATLGMHNEAKDVTKENVRRFLPWMIHEWSKKGMAYDATSRTVKVDENMRSKATKIVALFEQARKQLEAM